MARWTLVMLAVAGCDRTYMACSGVSEFTDGEVDDSGEVPVFDWAFGNATVVSVFELEGENLGRLMWHVQCGGDNLKNNDQLEEQVCIRTPIAYGERVDSPFLDTVNLTAALPLTPGATYQVRISTLVEDDGPPLEQDRPEWLSFLAGDEERDDPRCGSGFSTDLEFVAKPAGDEA